MRNTLLNARQNGLITEREYWEARLWKAIRYHYKSADFILRKLQDLGQSRLQLASEEQKDSDSLLRR
jgi:hypothetical protein